MKLRNRILLVVLFVSMIWFVPNVVQADTEGVFEYTVNSETNEATIAGLIDHHITEVIIPETINGKKVTRIGEWAFYNDQNITSINIPNTVTSIGKNAFYNCAGLESMEIPDEVNIIEDYMFYNCSSLRNIKLPENVSIIGEYAFYCCKNLENIEIPEAVTNIGEKAFYGCKKIVSLKIPNGVIRIENYAFDQCTNLTNIELSDSITSIGKMAFEGTGIEKIKIPENITIIEEETFCNCLNLTEIEIPNGVTKIGRQAFFHCEKLNKIDLPKNLTSIEESAFSNCISIENICIPNTVTSIGQGVFSRCEKLKSISLSKNITTIPKLSFSFCKNLTKIELPESITSIEDNAFNSCNSLLKFEIPKNVVSISESAFYSCSELISIDVDEENDNYISEDGVLFNKDKTIIIQYPIKKENVEYIIPTTVTEIKNHQFTNCLNLRKIEIPDNVTLIGDYAFFGCSYLKDVKIPNNVISIGKYAFASCRFLNDIELSKNLQSIGEACFSSCPGLEKINIPSSVIEIGEGAFYNVTVLQVVIPSKAMEYAMNNNFRYVPACNIMLSNNIDENLFTIEETPTLKINNEKLFTILKNKSELDLIVAEDGYIYETIYMEIGEGINKVLNKEDNTFFEICNIDGKRYIKYDLKVLKKEEGKYIPLYNELKNITIQFYKGDEILLEQEYSFGYIDAEDGMKADLYIVDEQGNYVGNKINDKYGKTDISVNNYSNIITTTQEDYYDKYYELIVNKYIGTIGYVGDLGQFKYEKEEEVNGEKIYIYKKKIDDISLFIKAQTINISFNNKLNNIEIVIEGDERKLITDTNVNNIDNRKYTGEEIKPDITIIDGDKKLEQDKDYTLEYSNNINSGIATVVITGKGTYTGITKANFNIEKLILKKPSIKGSYIYNTKEQMVELNDFDSSKMYLNNNKRRIVGSQQVKILLKDTNNYIWEDDTNDVITLEWTINQKSIEDLDFELDNKKIIYDGNEKKPNIIINYEDVELSKNTDYSIEYENNINSGEGTVKITGINNYVGTKLIPFNIEKKTLNKPKIQGTYTYNKEEQEVKVSNYDENTMEFDGETAGINAKKYNFIVKIKDKENYQWEDDTSDDYILEWTIYPKSIKNIDIDVDTLYEDYEFNGNAICPNIIAWDDTKKLQKGLDYEIEYENNINSGKASVKFSGNGNYTGSNTYTFKISKKIVNAPEFDDETYIYNGTEQTIELYNFDSNFMNITNNTRTNAGVQEVVITLKDKENYLWDNNTNEDIKITWTIEPILLKNCIIEEINEQEYTGSKIEPNVMIKNENTTLVKDKDYALDYRNNTKEGTATVIITGICNYKGETEREFEIKDSYMESLIDMIPNTIELNIPEVEFEKAKGIVKNRVEEAWKNNGIDIEHLEEQGIELSIIASPIHTTKEEFYMAFINLERFTIEEDGNKEYNSSKQKNINLTYNNTSNHNATDESYVKNLEIKSPKYYTINLEYFNNDIEKFVEEILIISGEYYTNLINDDSIVIKTGIGAGGGNVLNWETGEGGTAIAIFKNGILYDIRLMGHELFIPIINVPSRVRDNELINYITNIIEPYYQKRNTEITKIQQGNTLNIPNGYTVYTKDENEYIVVKRENKNISDCNIRDIENQTYTGKELKPSLVIKDEDYVLEEGTDYELSYSNSTEVGTAIVTITGIGNYTGETSKEFEIEKVSLNKPTINGTYIYNGKEQTVNLNNFDENVMTITNNKSTNAGKKSVTIELKDKQNYQWQDGTIENVILDWEIQQKNIKNMTVTIDEESYIYDGKDKTPIPTVKDENTILVKDTDYSIEYENNIEVGTATIIITGKGNYDGELKKTFKIIEEQKNIAELTITGITDTTYTGKEIQQNIVVKDENTTLKENTDYTVTYKNNKNVGTATVTITGIGNYTGTKELTFKINKATYDMSKVKFENLTVTYDGKSHKITATGLPTGVNVTYKNNDKTNVGTYTVTAVFTGDTSNYNTISDMTATLKINAKNISSTNISSVGNQTYTGKDIKPSVVVKDGNITLKNGTDYTVSYTNPRNTGKATITITGKGNYTGTKTTTFNIIPSQVTNLKTKSQKEKEITIQWSKNGGNVTGYKVYQYNSKTKKWDYVGKTSNTNYTIKKLKAGTTYSFKVRAYKTIDGTQYFGSYSSKLNASTTPSTTKLKTLSTKNKKVTVKWNKVSGATGYEIYMSTSKNKGYSKIKTITKASTVSYTKGSLKKNKTYYFKIRTYRTVNGKKIYSSYSNIKQIKVK